MKTIEIIKLAKGYYVRCAYGANCAMTFCKTKKEAEQLAKSLR